MTASADQNLTRFLQSVMIKFTFTNCVKIGFHAILLCMRKESRKLISVLSTCIAMGAISWLTTACGSNQKMATPDNPGAGSSAIANTQARSGETETPDLRVDPTVEGKVVFADPTLRYVVVDFMLNALPPAGAQFEVYREGERIGAVEIGKFTRDTVVSADMTEGEIEVNDRVVAVPTRSR